MKLILATIVKFFHNTFVIGIFFIASVLFFFSGIFFGLDFTDTFYHLNQALNPPDGHHLYPVLLSSLFIKSIVGIFGPDLISLRFINAFLIFFSVFLPFLFVKTAASKREIMFHITCILFLIAPLNANILGYDTLSIFVNALIFSVTLFYIKNPKTYVLLILSLLCSISILIRLPNAVVLPIIIFIILYKQKQENIEANLFLIKYPLLFLLSSLLCVGLVYCLYYKEWSILLEASLGSVSHDLEALFLRYIKDGLKVILFCTFITASFFLFKQITKRKSKAFAYGIILMIYFFFVPFFLIAGYSYPLFLVAMALCVAGIHMYNTSGKSRRLEYLTLFVFVIFLFINPVGSNTGLLKASFLILLLPFILSSIKLKEKNFWISIIIVLIPFSIFGKLYRTYEDGNIFTLDSALKFDKLYPIRTSDKRQEFLQEIDQEVKKLREQGFKVYFYGNKSHIFQYLYPNTTLGIKAFDQPVDDLIFFPHIKNKFKNNSKVAIFLIANYPESTKPVENVVEKELVERNFEKNQQGPVRYYLRPWKK